MKILFLQPAAQVSGLGVNLKRFGRSASFGVVNLSTMARKLNTIGAIVNCQDVVPTARRVIELAAKAGVPRVYLFDGIYDLSNAYCNPAHKRLRMSQMDPMLYSHVACVDRWSHRVFAQLGAKTHAWLPSRAAPSPKHDVEKAEIAADFLIATARSPVFSPEERPRLERLLSLIIAALDRVGASYCFRIGDAKLLTRLRISSERNDLRNSFAECISRYRCLITTPSTIATTAMLAGKPTATLDYRDSPLTQQTGWRIHESTQIDGILASMLEPAADRMTFQEREVAHLRDRESVEEFILRAARKTQPPNEPSLATLPRGKHINFDFPLRWVYVKFLKPFRKGF